MLKMSEYKIQFDIRNETLKYIKVFKKCKNKH